MRTISRIMPAILPATGALVVAFAAFPARASSVLIESWENTLDGWQAPSPDGNNSSYTPSFSTTTGVTDGNYSLAMTGTAAPDYSIMLNSPYSMTLTNTLADATSVSLDVFAPSGSFGGALGIDMDIGNNAIGFESLDNYTYQSPTIGTESTITVPISSSLASELATSGDPTQFYIQVGGNYTPGNETIYFDNLRAINNATTPQTWTPTSSGNWNSVANWSGGTIPNAVDAEADFFGAITANSTVYTDLPITVGTINFNNPNKYVITGSSNLTLQTSSGDAQVIVQQGTQELNLPITLASNTIFNVSSGANLVVANPLTIDSGVALTTTGDGTVTYQSIITVNSNASIAFADSTHAHELSLASGATATLGGPVLEVDSISNLGTINLLNNKLLVNYGSGPDPIASIAAWIKNGYYNLAGPQIISTDIAADDAASGLSYGIGYADSADPGNPANLPSGTVEVMFTLLGDANLDGVVNSEDFTPFSQNLGQSGSWDDGDFNYDGTVNAEDFTLFSHNLGQSATLAGGALQADGLSLANVPEPGSLLSLVFVAALTNHRRKRRLRS